MAEWRSPRYVEHHFLMDALEIAGAKSDDPALQKALVFCRDARILRPA